MLSIMNHFDYPDIISSNQTYSKNLSVCVGVVCMCVCMCGLCICVVCVCVCGVCVCAHVCVVIWATCVSSCDPSSQLM